MSKTPNHWFVKETAQDVAKTACELIVSTAQKLLLKKQQFNIVLAGGTTPEHVYSLLAKENCDWKSWHIYLGDERCYPANHPERNSQMVERIFLNKVSIPKENIHFIPAELGAEQAAITYRKVVNDVLPFDMVLLGMGEDGHTASLFPEHNYSDMLAVEAVFNAPKNPPERVSLAFNSLSSNNNLIIMVTGKSKQEAVKKWKNGKDLPVARISSKGTKTILLDKEAFS